MHLNYELIPDYRLAGGDIRSPLLIVEHPTAVTEETAAGVLHFLTSGGRVLWSGRGLDAQLQEVLGIEIVADAAGAELLHLVGEGESMAFRRPLYRVECRQAEPRIEVQTTDGKIFPLLTSRRVGRGQVFYAASPLMTRLRIQAVPLALLERVFDTVLPPGERRVTTDAPDDVEIVLRQKDNRQVVHLVNLAAGQREVTPWRVHRLRKITNIPPVPPCHLSLRLPARPMSVYLEPQHRELHDCPYADGRLEVLVPEFAIHQMIVVTPPR